MGKIDLYIIRKFLGTFLFAIILIISISVVFDIAEKTDDFIDIPLKVIIVDYYLNFIPYFANLFSSLFTFIAVIFFTSKMASNTEIIAILSGGVSFKRLMLPYFVSALIIACLSFVLSNYIIPPANKTRLEFLNNYVKKNYRNKERNIHRQIEPGLYIYMYNYTVSSNTGYKFTLEKFDGKKLISKLSASSIKWNDKKDKWTIHNFNIRNIDEKGNESFDNGSRRDTTLNFRPKEFSSRTNIVEAMNYSELNTFIEEQTLRGDSKISSYKVEKYKRTSNAFATFILTLIGVSLACRKVRGGIGLHLGLGLLLSFSYILFMEISIVFATNGNMNPLLAVWLPNIIYSIIAIYLYRIAPK